LIRLKNVWQLVPVAIIIILLISEVIWYIPPHPKPGTLQVLEVSPGFQSEVTVKYQLSATLPLDATVVITPVVEQPQDLPIYVFYDENYPGIYASKKITLIQGSMLWVHVKTELYLRNYSAEVKLASAEELESLFSTNSTAIVIMASGALPSNVFSWETNLVKPWIDSGGTLIWFGWVPGWYVVEKGQRDEEISCNMSQHLYQEGPRRLGLEGYFEYMPLEEHPTVAEISSPLSNALDTTYNLIQQAPYLHKVLSENGLVLGKIGGNSSKLRSSISMIRVGEGKIIIFGFFLTSSLVLNGPELAARDIAQILCSGILQVGADPDPSYRIYHLLEGETKTDTVELSVDGDVYSEIIGLIVYGYASRDSIGLLFHREFVLLKKSE